MAYLYLENKMFINVHLLKAGLAEVDERVEFKYKEKFKTIKNASHGRKRLFKCKML
jgi:site-specific DNA-methyltransferase (adenine-specific)